MQTIEIALREEPLENKFLEYFFTTQLIGDLKSLKQDFKASTLGDLILILSIVDKSTGSPINSTDVAENAIESIILDLIENPSPITKVLLIDLLGDKCQPINLALAKVLQSSEIEALAHLIQSINVETDVEIFKRYQNLYPESKSIPFDKFKTHFELAISQIDTLRELNKMNLLRTHN